jgi:hypothetical protein
MSSTSPDDRSVSRYLARRPETGHGLALEPLREILRQRPAQIAATHLDLGEARALHRRLQGRAAPSRLREVRASFNQLGSPRQG